MYSEFRGCTVDVHFVTLLLTKLQQTLHYVRALNVCHLALHEVSVMDGGFQTVRVYVYSHALN